MICDKLTFASLVLAVLILALVQTTLCQNYHFSNGWYAGKKRSTSTSTIRSDSNDIGSSRGKSSYALFEESCTIRPDSLQLINRIIQDEVARMQKSCVPDLPSGLTEMLENAANTLESDGKW